jgi:hypothetical protein
MARKARKVKVEIKVNDKDVSIVAVEDWDTVVDCAIPLSTNNNVDIKINGYCVYSQSVCQADDD